MQNPTLIYCCGVQALSLGMIQYSFAGEQHPISPHKHPRSEKKFIPTAPSTKVKLLEEEIGRNSPSRIYEDASEPVGECLIANFLQTCLATASKSKTHGSESQAKLKRMSLQLCLNLQRRIKQFITCIGHHPQGLSFI